MKRHGLTYLATPYSKYPEGIDAAFEEASELAGRLLQLGLKVFSPIAHTHPIATYAAMDPYALDIWLPLDDEFLHVCKTLFVAQMDGWQDSKGVAHEIEFFRSRNKPVFYVDPMWLTVSHFPANHNRMELAV